MNIELWPNRFPSWVANFRPFKRKMKLRSLVREPSCWTPHKVPLGIEIIVSICVWYKFRNNEAIRKFPYRPHMLEKSRQQIHCVALSLWRGPTNSAKNLTKDWSFLPSDSRIMMAGSSDIFSSLAADISTAVRFSYHWNYDINYVPKEEDWTTRSTSRLAKSLAVVSMFNFAPRTGQNHRLHTTSVPM